MAKQKELHDHILTGKQARRIGKNKLAGKVVQVTYHEKFGQRIAKDVFYNGERICGTLHLTGL